MTLPNWQLDWKKWQSQKSRVGWLCAQREACVIWPSEWDNEWTVCKLAKEFEGWWTTAPQTQEHWPFLMTVRWLWVISAFSYLSQRKITRLLAVTLTNFRWELKNVTSSAQFDMSRRRHGATRSHHTHTGTALFDNGATLCMTLSDFISMFVISHSGKQAKVDYGDNFMMHDAVTTSLAAPPEARSW